MLKIYGVIFFGDYYFPVFGHYFRYLSVFLRLCGVEIRFIERNILCGRDSVAVGAPSHCRWYLIVYSLLDVYPHGGYATRSIECMRVSERTCELRECTDLWVCARDLHLMRRMLRR